MAPLDPFTPELLDDLKIVHADLHNAVDEALHLYWDINDGLVYWLGTIEPVDEELTITSLHFSALIVWLERLLYSNRSSPLETKGALKRLGDLEKAVYPIINASAELAAEPVIITAKLGLISLAPGMENISLATLADNLEFLLDGATEDIGVDFPNALLPSVGSIADYLEKQVKEVETDSSVPADPEPDSETPVTDSETPVTDSESPVTDSELEMF